MAEFSHNQRIIAPSLLAADFSKLAEEVQRATTAGADWLHLDVMDGHFVDNISFGPAVVTAVRKLGQQYLDVHLMISRPDHYLERFLAAGADGITVHLEAEHDVSATLRRIREAGKTAGLAINPTTPLESALPYLEEIDLLLCMTVVPGFGGQAFMHEVMPKVREAVTQRDHCGLTFHIQVDGGVAEDTADACADAGANVWVAGSSTYGAANMAAAIDRLRNTKA